MASLFSRLELERARRPTATDADRVRTIAAELIDELGITQPPVDVEMVASMLDIANVVADPALVEAGCLFCAGDGEFEIRVRGTDSLGRQRFTICHECSHTFFPGFATKVQYRCSPSTGPSQNPDLEALCDVAAGELLFPSMLFVADVRGTPFGLEGLEELADRYKGSLEATGHRLVSTWPEPSALLIFTVRQKPSEARTTATPRLRLDSAHPEGGWPFFRRHKSVAHGDVFDRALEGEVVSETTTISGIATEPVRAEVHAQLYPLIVGGRPRARVVALVRRVAS
jgi:hypothetical protein